MVARVKKPYVTPLEYLEQERKAKTKSEYRNGVIVAIAGASPEHNILTFDLAMILGPQLRGGNCQGFSGDLRLHVRECNAYYPDVAIVCGEPQYEEQAGLGSLLDPTLIVEVLSDSTEHTDRVEKFDCYQTLPSFTSYVLIAQNEPRIELLTRQADGSWRLDLARGRNAVLPLAAIGCEPRLAEVYARVEFPPVSVVETAE